MSTDPYRDRLSDFLDGEMPEAEWQQVEAHLAVCEACRTTLAELQDVVFRARALDDRPPADDLWDGIAALIAAPPSDPDGDVVPLAEARRRRRFSFTVPQLAAAAVALMTLSGGSVWLASSLAPGDRPTAFVVDTPRPGIAPVAGAPDHLPAALRDQPTGYATAVAELEGVLAAGREQLSPSTVQVLERNLAVIDSAIAEAQRAVEADPQNAYLSSHLANTMRRKLELLRRAATLATAAS